MNLQLSERMLRKDAQGEFVKKMLQAAGKADLISFAGGLPNPASFPVRQLAQAAQDVLAADGAAALQYSTTQGYAPLRRFIAERYAKKGIAVDAENILITNGSQQGLDLLAGTLLNEGDYVLAEKPAYLSALQTFHLYGAKICAIPLDEDGIRTSELEAALKQYRPKLFYAVPDFQNPTGLTYTNAVRDTVANMIKASNALIIEDNPYGELRFSGAPQSSFQTRLGEQCVMLGSFSKIVSPGMRIGWISSTHRPLMEKLIAYKQITDVHTNIFGQMVLTRYLENTDLEAHIEKIRVLYAHQAQVMLAAMRRAFPREVSYTRPEGGMFLWVTLPEGFSALELSRQSARAGVAIAAGDPFYDNEPAAHTFRLNYTNCDEQAIEKGIAVLGELIKKMLRK